MAPYRDGHSLALKLFADGAKVLFVWLKLAQAQHLFAQFCERIHAKFELLGRVIVVSRKCATM